MDYTIIGYAEFMRSELKKMEEDARLFIAKIKKEETLLGNKGETIAQATLGMRHIEDARMKFGKVIQYANTEPQENCFDKKE